MQRIGIVDYHCVTCKKYSCGLHKGETHMYLICTLCGVESRLEKINSDKKDTK